MSFGSSVVLGIVEFGLCGLNLGVFLMSSSDFRLINLVVACGCLALGIVLLAIAVKEY